MDPKRTPYYVGRAFARMNLPDGGLPHVVGASNFQVMRANRAHPEWADSLGNTYNHAPMLTYWRDKFHLQYLTNPTDEHQGAGASLLVRSDDGIHWTLPEIVFPVIIVPAGVYRCADGEEILVTEDKPAFMHQRMAFFHSPDDRLLATGFYGHTPHTWVNPWVKYGIGRVVREVYEDGSMGPPYFLRILESSGWTRETVQFPFYSESPDRGFVAACDALLTDRFVTQQWSDEHGEDEPLLMLTTRNAEISGFAEGHSVERTSSFSWYHTDEGASMGFWKQAVVGRTDDNGDNWVLTREPSFVTSGGKTWAQRTQDGRYVAAYLNSLSSEHRYPLVTVTSDDGIVFDDMGVVFGEVPPRRYEGMAKDFGPQYIRGITEGHKEYPLDAMWLCHSVNKEDIWVTRVPLPIVIRAEQHVHDRFDGETPYIKGWSIYSGIWAPVGKTTLPDGSPCLRLADCDPVDYARAERQFPPETKVRVAFDVMSDWCHDDNKMLDIELTDDTGIVACRVQFGDLAFWMRHTSVTLKAFPIPRKTCWHHVVLETDCNSNYYTLSIDKEKPVCALLMQKVNEVSRLVLRTKPLGVQPHMDIRPIQPDLSNSDAPILQRVYYIRNVETSQA